MAGNLLISYGQVLKRHYRLKKQPSKSASGYDARRNCVTTDEREHVRLIVLLFGTRRPVKNTTGLIYLLMQMLMLMLMLIAPYIEHSRRR